MSRRPGGLPRWFPAVVAAGAVGVLAVAGIAITPRLTDHPAARKPSPTATFTPRASAGTPTNGASGTADAGASATGNATSAAAVSALLDARAKAVLSRDRAAYRASIDPADPAFLRAQMRTFDNLAAVPLSAWRYAVDDSELGSISSQITRKYGADEVYAPKVSLRYGLRGFDPDLTDLALWPTFVRRGERWYVAGDDDFDRPGHSTSRAVWDFEPVGVVTTQHTLVIGPRNRHTYLQMVAREVDAAIPRVSAVWGSEWSQRVVVLVPTSQRQVSDLIGTQTALGHIAAVSVSQAGDPAGGQEGARVIINPPNFDKLTRLGKRVVLTHEVTHVASRASTTTNSPAWLVEGFADYVGYRGAGVDARVAAQELAAEIRRGKMPSALATFADFDGDSGRLPQAYEGSWLACRMIAERTSEKTLVAFYRAVGTSKGDKNAALEDAMSTLLKTTPASFTASWRAYVKAQLS